MQKTVGFVNFRKGPAGNNQAAIVFVHGFTGDLEKTWKRIPEFLGKDRRLDEWDLLGIGYESHRRFDLPHIWSADARLEELALMLHGRPELSPERYKRLAFVAHSMGGLVVQQALVCHQDLRDRTSHVVLFGTPSGGLVKAHFLSFWKRQIQNMDVKGAFIRDLRDKWKSLNLDADPPFALMALAGASDQFVPPESSLEPFPFSERDVIPGTHVTMLDAKSARDPCVQKIIQLLCKGVRGPRNSARVAIETGDFADTIRLLWPNRKSNPKELPAALDDYGVIKLAIALEKTGDRDAAIAVLRGHKSQNTDPLGALAGRLKRRWWVFRKADDLSDARSLYQEAYEKSVAKNPPNHEQAYYHAINLAYLALAAERDFDAARPLAEKVLVHVAKASDPGQKHWRLASEADALMILGRTDEAIAKHQEAAKHKLEPWEAASMEEQALRIADLCGLGKVLPDQFVKALANAYEGEA